MIKAAIHPHGDGKETVTIFCPACQTIHCITHSHAGWSFNGSSDKPTIGGSIGFHGEENGGVYCHSLVENGMIQFLIDSGHKYAGQTLELPEVPEIYQ
jgi:hypothetical protein